DRVFARISQYLEFVADVAADRAGIRRHRAEFQTQPRENARISFVHRLVRFIERRLIQMKRIGILHQEFARAHHAETRTDFVAEFGLYLEERDRQLLVAGNLAAHEIADDFLVRGAETVFLLLAVAHFQERRTVFFPAAGFFPQFARLHARHGHFDRARLLHFFAHDTFDLPQHAQTQRRPGVDAGGELADHAGAQHQPV